MAAEGLILSLRRFDLPMWGRSPRPEKLAMNSGRYRFRKQLLFVSVVASCLFVPNVSLAQSLATVADDTKAPSGTAPRIGPVSTTVEVNANTQTVYEGVVAPYHVTQAEVLSSAGTFEDFTRYLQVLPGVAWNSDISNDVMVQGGHPSENQYVVDAKRPRRLQAALSFSNNVHFQRDRR